MKEAEIAPAQGLFLAPKSPFCKLEKKKKWFSFWMGSALHTGNLVKRQYFVYRKTAEGA